MRGGNGTAVTEFVLLGFSCYHSLRGPLFWGVLLVYLVTLMGNSLIILLTLADAALHSPMYFFLRHFSGLEMLYTTTVVPRVLTDLLSPHHPASQLLYPAVFLLPVWHCGMWPAHCQGL